MGSCQGWKQCPFAAAELGPQNIRVDAISAGPIRTLASSVVEWYFLDMIHHVEEVAPLRRTVTQVEVGNAAFLCSDLASYRSDPVCGCWLRNNEM